MIRTILRLWGAALLAAKLVAACDQTPAPDSLPDEGPVLESRAETAPRPEPDQSDFVYLRYAVNTDAVTPELCLTFSASLAPQTDYSAYVQIDEPVAFNVEGSNLCVGGLVYGQTRTLQLRAGLPAADGRTLDSDESITLSFDDRPSRVGFSGAGVILPRVDADGLAVETVNVDEVDIHIRRVNDRALAFRSITQGYAAVEGEWRWTPENERPGEAGVSVWRGRMDTAGARNALTTTVFPLAETLGALEPGAYYLTLQDGAALDRDAQRPARAERWLIVTDLAFTAYRGDGGLDVVVRSLQTARPIGDVQVHLIAQSNEILATARTNADGRVDFDHPLMNGAQGDRPALLAAYGPEGDFAILDLDRAPVDLSSQPVTGRDRNTLVDSFVYLDRGIYRPGEAVVASALLRDQAGGAVQERSGALVLYQPNGLEVSRHRFEAAPEAGGINHRFDLPRAAARGSWRVDVMLDGLGVVGSTRLSVEDFVPQRIALDLTVEDQVPILLDETRTIQARVRFLYGAPGVGLIVDAEPRLQFDPQPFPEHAGFEFGLHDAPVPDQILNTATTVADGEGAAALTLDPRRQGLDMTRPLRLRAVVRVREPGGRVVAQDVRIPYRPRSRYVGLQAGFDNRAERNAPVVYNALMVDELGAPVSGSLDWRLLRTNYTYDWYRQNDGRWRWRRTAQTVLIETGQLHFDEGASSITTRPLNWGDYVLVLADNGGDLASSAFRVGWRGQAQDGVGAPDEVQLVGPQSVQPGEVATLAIQAPYAGLAEVVIATDRVLQTYQIEAPEEGAEISLPVTEDWGAGVYAMVNVYTPRDALTEPTPRRAVGVTYIPVDVSDRTINLTLNAPELTHPNQTLSFNVQAERNGSEPVWMTLAAVDEGILQLTGFASPDPVQWVFGKPRLGVELLDDYGRLLDPNQGAAAPVRSGGDQIGGAGLSVVPTQTVALFSGPVRFDATGQARIDLDLPDFNGELRLMAVAWSDSSLGAVSQPITVRDDVPSELILPRFLAPGDTAQATASVDNVAGLDGGYVASVNASGPVDAQSSDLEMNLQQGQRSEALFTVQAMAQGVGEIRLDVNGPEGFTAQSIYPIEVRSAFLPVSDVRQITLQPGDSFTPAADLLSSYAPGSASLQVSATPNPIDITALFESLYNYPHACTEQIVSRTIPLLYADQLTALVDQDAPDGAHSMVQDTIETLVSRQGLDGAFGLWSVGDRRTRPWIGVYATDFISRAKQSGYPVPQSALERALDAIQPLARGELWRARGYYTQVPNTSWSTDTSERITDRSAAYALYVLARHGRADRSRLRYMHDERINQIESPLARAHIGAALALMGDRARARSAFEAAIEALGYSNTGDWYQSPLRDMAGVTALAAEAGQSDLVEGLLADRDQELTHPGWMNTQTKAHLIYAAHALSGGADDIQITYSGEAETPSRVRFDETDLPMAGTFTNTGDRPLYVTVLARGAPLEPPIEASNDLTVTKTITDLSGQPVDFDSIAQGDELLVIVDLEPERRMTASYIIVDMLPAGFEIETVLNPQSTGYGVLGEISALEMAEARDDRFVAAVDANRDQPVRIGYVVRAVTPGQFTRPGVVAEDMYQAQVHARSPAGRVTIRP